MDMHQLLTDLDHVREEMDNNLENAIDLIDSIISELTILFIEHPGEIK